MLRDRILSLRHTTSDLKHSNSNSNREFETETERNTPTTMPISGGRDNNSATISTYVFISLLIIFSRSHFSVCTVSILLRYNFVHTKFSVSMCFCFRFFLYVLFAYRVFASTVAHAQVYVLVSDKRLTK